MKTKSTIMATLLVVVLAFQASAQLDFGIKAGGGFFTYEAINYYGDKMENKLIPRFHGGVFCDLVVSPQFSIQPSLLFATKGGTNQFFETLTLNLNYLEVPVNFVYRAVLGQGAFLVGAGPYLGYGLSGSWKGAFMGVSLTGDVKFTNQWGDDDEAIYLKPFDFGLNVMAVYEFAVGFSIGLHAQMGLTNYYLPDPSIVKISSTDKSSLKNIGFSLSLGYKFGNLIKN